jgi:hypothetical protein
MALKGSLRSSQTNIGYPVFSKVEFNFIPWVIHCWIEAQILDCLLSLNFHTLKLIFRKVRAVSTGVPP